MTVRLRPFFSYYGTKWRAAPRYPAPRTDTIIEPFAGAAGYSQLHYQKQVKLYDLDEKIVGTWQYLIHVSEAELLALPDIGHEQTVDDFRLPQEAKWLIGYWLNVANSAPCKSPSKWMRQYPHRFWSAAKRETLASQLRYIRHWTVERRDYREAPNDYGTWFIDPPYQQAGKHYRHSADAINFTELAAWCRSRAGDVIVCENMGADWLPFLDHGTCAGTAKQGVRRRSVEALFYSIDPLS